MTELQQTLQALANALQNSRQLWAPEPFLLTEAPWTNSHPEMQQALLALDQTDVNAMLQDSAYSEAWCAEHLPSLFVELRRWQPELLSPTFGTHHDPMALGIGGRKWQQIEAFKQSMHTLPAVINIADWCGGKGYLAGYLSAHLGCQVDCLEIDTNLCAEGFDRVDQFNLPVKFHRCDVLQPISDTILMNNERHVALHACGELHRSMWRQTLGRAEQVCLSPCCYHLGATDDFHLSEAAKHAGLHLSAKEMRIPLLETVTGGQQAINSRRQEQIWRLAYETWRIEETGDTHYRPLRSLSKRFFKQDPGKFFEWAATQHALRFNRHQDIDAYLDAGRRRFEMSERLGIIRQGLKRYLEYFIVLDLACYAEEQGYSVRVVEFCPKHLTPRNLAVLAQRPFDPTIIPSLFRE
ncbi:MAG TPA: methyltransferase [Pseudomonadales bacterium]|nr:methyltransferase [Pseudomonadales bacterium]